MRSFDIRATSVAISVFALPETASPSAKFNEAVALKLKSRNHAVDNASVLHDHLL